MMRRMLAFVLALTMAAGMLPAAALAEETIPAETIQETLPETTAPAQETEVPEETTLPEATLPTEETAAPEETEPAAEEILATAPEMLAVDCGDQLSWTLEGGTLTISGTGAMYDYSATSDNPSPWRGGASAITAIVIEEGVTSVGDYAFIGMGRAVSVSFPSTLERVGDYAFAYCELLTGAGFAEGLKTIGEGAFLSCSEMTRLSIPQTVTSIGADAFQDCGSVVVTFGGTMEQWKQLYSGRLYVVCSDGTIDPDANCGDALTWSVSDEGVLTISGTGKMYDYGDAAPNLAPWCSQASRITAIVIEEGVTSIGENAFLGLGCAASVTLPTTLEQVGDYAFAFCGLLSSAVFRDGLVSVGSFAFTYCDSLKEVVLPGSVAEVGDHPFFECSQVTVTFEGTVEQWQKLCTDELYVVCTDGTIDPGAKCGDTLTWAVSEEGVLTISGTGEMYNYYTKDVLSPWHSSDTAITSLVIGEGVTSIGEYAFIGMDLQSVALPSTLQRIGVGAFAYCARNPKALVLPEGLLEIGKNAFLYCEQMENLTIPASVTFIHAGAFTGCDLLTVTYYGTPETWAQIYGGSFDNVEFIEPTPEAPDQGTTAEGLSWNIDETGLLTVTGEGPLTADENILGNAEKITSVVIASGVTEIGDSAFSGLTALTEVTLPETVTEIGSSAFADCVSLTSIDLTHVTKLGGGCFYGCSALSVIDLSVNPTWVTEQKTLLTYKAESLPAAVDPSNFQWSLVSSTREDFTDLSKDGTLYISAPAEVTVQCEDTYTGLRSSWTLSSSCSPLVLMPEFKEPAEVKILTEDGEPAENEKQMVRFALYLDKEDVASGTYVFTVMTAGTDGETDLTNAKNLKWTSSNTAVATVKANADGTATVTVKKKADGAAVIQLSAKDTGAEGMLSIYVREYTPRLGDSAFTMNTLLTDNAVTTDLVESYGCAIDPESIALLEADGTESSRFTAGWDSGVLTIAAKETVAKNGAIKLTLTGTYANGELARAAVPFYFPIKITVKNAVPAITVKQAGKPNLFYNLALGSLSVTAKNAVITGISVEDCDFAVEYWNEEYGILTVYTRSDGKNLDNKGILKIWLEGYAQPIEKAVTIATEVKKPKLTPDYASGMVNSALGENSTIVQILTENGFVINMEETDLQITGDFADWSVNGTRLQLENIEKSGTAVISIREPDWNQAITLKYKVTVSNKMPTVKLSASTLELHSLFTQHSEWVTAELSHGGMKIKNLEFAPTGKNAAEAEKIALVYEDGAIRASIADEDDAPAPGTYNFSVTAVLDNEDETQLKSVTLKVKVIDTLPTVKLGAAAVKLNKALFGETAKVQTTWKAVGKHMEFDLAGFVPAQQYPGLKLDWNSNYQLTVRLTEDAAIGKQTLQLYPVFEDFNGQQVTSRTPVKLTVDVYDSTKITVTMASKGKLDAIVPDSAIEYTIKKITNALGEVQEAALYGPDADKFAVTPVAVNDSGLQTFKLIQKTGVQYNTKTAYKVGIKLYIGGIWVETPVKTVKVTQSKLKLSVLPKTVRYYQSQTGKLEATITLTAPEGASLTRDSIAVNAAKTDKSFIRALGNGNLTVNTGEMQVKKIYEKNGQICVDVTFDVRNTGYLTPGKSFSVVLDITPVGNAENTAPTQLKLTVKAYK